MAATIPVTMVSGTRWCIKESSGRDVNVIVASLQAGGVEFLVVDVDEVTKAVCKLLVSQSYFGCFFPKKRRSLG